MRKSDGEVLADRFWSKVDVRGPDECWTWTRWLSPEGYALIKVNGRPKRATHALMYVLHGEWPDPGAFLCHHCDNRACVNPAHVYVGSHAENMRDKAVRMRAVGRECGKPKLRDVWPEMLARRDAGVPVWTLASDYGVSVQAVKYHIRKRKISQVAP